MGGGIQAASSFITTIMANRAQDSLDWRIVVSKAIAQQLAILGVSLCPERDTVWPISPAKSRQSRAQLKDYVISNGIDGVFTFFGPAYVDFPVTHICGVADGWVTHSDFEAFRTIPSWLGRLKMLAVCIYKGYWLRRADAWFVEQEAAKIGLNKRLGIPLDRVHVIGNNCAAHYRSGDNRKSLDNAGETRVLVFASYYPNKNLESIPAIAAATARAGRRDVVFILTIAQDQPELKGIIAAASALGVAGQIKNIGPVNLADGPALYNACDILLMPSVLETFSAVYPEAMQMGVPVVTVDKAFARAICGDAALYYSSTDPDEAAACIVSLLTDARLNESMVLAGKARLASFPTADEKYALLHDLIADQISC